MKFLISIAIISLVVRDVHLTKSTKPAMNDITTALRRFTAYFTFRNYELNKGNTENILYSPISIAEVLGMVMTGARGTTYDSIKDNLLLDSEREYQRSNINNLFRKIRNKTFGKKNEPDTSDNATVTTAHKAYIEESFEILPDYITELRKNYAAEVELMDFSDGIVAADKINSWIKNKTEGLIPDLIQPADLTHLTRLVLVNALYFNAHWKKKFYNEGQLPFSNHAGQRKTMNFIGAKVLNNGAKGGSHSTVFVRYKSSVDTYMVIKKLPTKADWDYFFTYNNLTIYFTKTIIPVQSSIRRHRIHILMPEFDLTVSTDLTKVLSKMGMGEMFDMHAANFSGIATEEQLYLSKIKHQAKISVNKDGTRGGAATTAIFLGRSAVRVTRVVIDTPFVFSIVRNNHVLFFGAVKDFK